MSRTRATPLPSESAPPIDQLLAPFREFTSSAASGGILLLAAGIAALVWANSPFAERYEQILGTTLAITVGGVGIEETLHHWINDALMAVFFLLVGLEIKREILVGELASVRRAVLPVAAAAGGAVLPALIYLGVAGGGGDAARGWGVPMATDIAFALGALALLGSRVPLGLRVFVTALAIADDLLAVLVIALFYSGQLNVGAVAAAFAALACLVAANRLGVRRPAVYGLLGIALWVAVHESGVHATVAGVLLALTIPARTRLDAATFLERSSHLRDDFAGRTTGGVDAEHQHAALWELEEATEQAQAPMLRIEHSLQPVVAFAIVPLFALANAGVALPRDPVAAIADPVVLGVTLGLVVGKQVGITLAAWLVVRSGLAELPAGVGWRHVYGAAWLGGIGFTMSLFIAELAFGGSGGVDAAKVGILVASIVAGVGGFLILRFAAPAPAAEGGVPSTTG